MPASAAPAKITHMFARQRHKKALACFYEGYQAQMKKRYSKAIELYQQSIDLCPTAEAHTFLGWTYSFLGELENAMAECHRAIEVDPDFGNPYNDIGAYLIAQGRHDEALPYLEQALGAKRYRAYHFAHYNLARVYENQGNLLAAYRHYKQALERDPRYLIALSGMERIRDRIADQA